VIVGMTPVLAVKPDWNVSTAGVPLNSASSCSSASCMDNVPAIVRWNNGLVVTSTNPVHRGDILTIYLTGLGAVDPPVNDGAPGPLSPLSTTLIDPVVKIGGVEANVLFSGLVPGYVGWYVVNVSVSSSTPQGLSVPLTITQGGFTYSQNVRVVQQ